MMQISKEKLTELMNFLKAVEAPLRVTLPIVQFLEKEMKEVKEETKLEAAQE